MRDVGDAIPTTPPAILNNVFDEYNYFIISNLFYDNNPYDLNTHISKMCVQNAS